MTANAYCRPIAHTAHAHFRYWMLTVLAAPVMMTAAVSQAQQIEGRYVGELTIQEPDEYRMTAAGQSSFDNYDPNYGDPRQWDDCEPEVIPALLLTPGVATVDFVRVGDNLEMRFERDDAVRTIYLDGSEPRADEPSTGLGYSRGSWEGDVFVIDTTHLAGGVVIAQTSLPLSSGARVVERYTRLEDSMNLRLDLTVLDPENYHEPVEISRVFVWSPDAPLLPWDCVSLGPRHTDEMDMDELRQMLEQL